MGATGSNPFLPVTFPAGPPTTEKGVWEDGPGAYVNAAGTPIKYSGSDQVQAIVNVNPKPPRQTHPAAGDKNESKIK